MAYVRVGLSPDGGATHWLGTRLPYQAAFELLATGEPIGAQRLHALGVVNRVVATGTAVAHAVAMAERLAAGPAGALARVKRLLDGAAAAHPHRQLERERDALVECLFHADGEEGIRAFLEKRKPRFCATRAPEPGSEA
jgi:enoyl-CoA hydratase/carnithine racemase